jgi:hypothetical protein
LRQKREGKKLWNNLSESLKTQNSVDTLEIFWTNGRLNPAEERERIHKKDAKKHLQFSLPFFIRRFLSALP